MSRSWVVTAVLVLIVSCAGVSWALVETRTNLSHERERAASAEQRTAALNTEVEAAKARGMDLQKELEKVNKENVELFGRLQESVPKRMVMWNSCRDGCAVRPGDTFYGVVPDTFTWEIEMEGDTSAFVWILSLETFVRWNRGEPIFTLPIAGGWGPDKKLHGVFHDAEGCGSYVSVIRAIESGTIRPIVTISPANHPTGVCAK